VPPFSPLPSHLLSSLWMPECLFQRIWGETSNVCVGEDYIHIYTYLPTYTHTHTHIYIYIYPVYIHVYTYRLTLREMTPGFYTAIYLVKIQPLCKTTPSLSLGLRL
jgi:hypothetical protein